MNKAESKYFNTAVRMDRAFLEILQSKDFEYITVKEICEKAEVNRSTFYLHYETIDDLLSECIRYMGEQFVSYFDGKKLSGRINSADKENLYLLTSDYLTPYLTYIKDNRRLFQVTLERTNTLRADRSMEVLLDGTINPIMDQFGIPENDRKYIIAFYIEGIIAIIKVWLKEDCRDSIEKMISIIQRNVQNPYEK